MYPLDVAISILISPNVTHLSMNRKIMQRLSFTFQVIGLAKAPEDGVLFEEIYRAQGFGVNKMY